MGFKPMSEAGSDDVVDGLAGRTRRRDRIGRKLVTLVVLLLVILMIASDRILMSGC